MIEFGNNFVMGTGIFFQYTCSNHIAYTISELSGIELSDKNTMCRVEYNIELDRDRGGS